MALSTDMAEGGVLAKVRVYELAKEFGVDSKTVMVKLQEMGEFVRSGSSTIEAPVVQRLQGIFQPDELPNEIRSEIIDCQFNQASRSLARLRNSSPDTWERLRREIGELLGQRDAAGGAGQRRIEWLTGLWVAAAEPGTILRPPPDKPGELPQRRAALDGDGPNYGPPRRSKLRSEALGRALEDGFAGLLDVLFELSDQERVRIRKQTSGTQFGHDIEFDAFDKRTGLVRCHVECKNHAHQVGLDDIAPKLLQQLVYWEDKKLDYFIVIAPRATPSNELSRLAQICNEAWKLPFQVLLWSADEGVEELFRLTPDLYRTLYQRPAPKQTRDARIEIARRWAERFQPVARVPDSLRRYLTTPSLHQLYGEDGFENVRDDSITLGALTDGGAPIPDTTLHDNVREWLTSRDQRPLLLLAEFGDGKSFFGYELGLRLAAEFLEDPASGWVALRIPMRSLRESSQPSVLLERRLDEVGVSLADWTAVAKSGRTLVILDGFDEMSARLDPQTLAGNIETLARCIDYFPKSKVLVTSRTHFFEHISDYERFLEILGKPRILRIAPISFQQRLAHLESYAARIGEEVKLAKLRTLYDPIGLAAKPLFLQMIKDTLPDLPDGHFNEVVLYDLYVRKSLKRKALDLQPMRRVGEDQLVENLTVVLEELAVQLHVSRTDYVNLRDFDTGRREDLAGLLWAMSGAESASSGVSTPDARSRVGVRSLLKPVAGVDPERWPVDFFHRSMREFFVARALVRAVKAQGEQAKAVLVQVPLQPEIIDFACLLVRHPVDPAASDTPETFTHKLVSLAKSATLPLYKNRYLGGNALTLLFALNRQLPKGDWSDLALDHADLAGADLSGLSFRGSSLRNASLDNARLAGTDLSDADLTGLQLEQTAPVLALAFDPDSNTAYAAYGDRSVRRWTFGVGGRMNCATLTELDFRPTKLALSPFGDLVVKGPDTITVLSALGADETWHAVSRFPVSTVAEDVWISGDHIILRGKDQDGTAVLKRYDPIKRTVISTATGSRLFVLAGSMTLTTTHNRLLLSTRRGRSNLEVPLQTSLDVRQVSDDQVLLALGHEEGAVSLWRLHSLQSRPQLAKVWEHDAHTGSVTDVLLSGMFVLSGGMDRTICLFTLTDNWSANEPVRLHRTLECAGVKIDGIQGPREKAKLASALRATSPPPTMAITPRQQRPSPTPSDVFGNRRRS